MSFELHLENIPKTVELSRSLNGVVTFFFIDERLLPAELTIRQTTSWIEVVDAIADLGIRGAPAIGVAGAAAVLMWISNECTTEEQLMCELRGICERVATTRPTAVNLRWAVTNLSNAIKEWRRIGATLTQVREAAFGYVEELAAQDESANRAIGANGAALFTEPTTFLTHCNAGSLATVFYGTALGVIYATAKKGLVKEVYADETRPVGQGARLTTWELTRAGVPTTLICDNMAATLMAQGKIDAVIVGADRIAANGDVANKIGTYGVAVLARYHNIPFYVAAPTSTLDFSISRGDQIPIEERPVTEVAQTLAAGTRVYNPSFDVTPAELVTAIITETGVYAPSDIARALQ